MSDRSNTNNNYSKRLEELYNYDSIADYFPYESYDESYGLYANQRSLGFVLEVGIYTGSNEEIEKELAGLFKSVLPEGSNIQFLLVAGSKIDHILDNWENARSEASYDIIRSLAKERRKYFEKLATDRSESFRVRDLRLIVSCSIPSLTKDELELKNCNVLKKQFEMVLTASGSWVKSVEPEGLIRLLDEIINYEGTTNSSKKEWNQFQPIRDQILDPSTIREIKEDRINLNKGEWEYRFYSVRKYPHTCFLRAMDKLIGDKFRDSLRIPCSFVIHYGVHIEKSKFRKTSLLAKANNVDNQAKSPLGKWIPALIKEAQEWNFVRDQLEQGERLVRTNYQVLLIDKPDHIMASESLLQTLYRSNGWELGLDRYVTLPSFISMLPLSWGEGSVVDMAYFRKLKTTLSHEPTNVLPIQGEFKGTNTPGILLAGRMGQLQYWFPFDGDSGNFNISICGRSGSGKSVFMQNIAEAVLGLNGNVFVLDVGRSFEKQIKNFKEQFIEFSTKSNLCLNPFTTINDASEENVADSLSILKPIVSLMVAPKAGTTDAEDAIIERGLNTIWRTKGKEGCIDDLAKWCLSQDDDLAKNIGKMLYPYSIDGAYGRFFNGRANIDFSSRFIVIELQELKERKDLQSVVVQIFILLITNRIILGNKQRYSSIIFDEAWDLLRGKQGGPFIEALARTLRKFKGSLVVGTQSLNDFYSSSGAEAAFNNSDWLCMLSQKKESIELLKRGGKFSIDEYTQSLLNSVRTKQGEYAEVMIMHERGSFIGRLMLDPYSKILYSTRAEEDSAVMKLAEGGMPLEDAIRVVAEQRYGKW